MRLLVGREVNDAGREAAELATQRFPEAGVRTTVGTDRTAREAEVAPHKCQGRHRGLIGKTDSRDMLCPQLDEPEDRNESLSMLARGKLLA